MNRKISAADGALVLDLAMPKELGGSGAGHNPEQLFAAGYASCTEVTATVGIGKTDAGGFGLTVALKVSTPGLDRDVAERLAHAAHQVCPYSNAVRGNVDVEVSVA